MPPITDEAVCVGSWDWSETSQTVALFSRTHGLVRALAKGARREGKKFSGGVEVLTRGEMIAVLKQGDALAVLASWDLLEFFPATRASLAGFYAGMYMIDVVRHAIHDHDPHPGLYDALLACLRALAARGPAPDEVARLLWAALAETGHQPELDRDVLNAAPLPDAETHAFLPRRGGLTSDATHPQGRSLDEPVWRVRSETVRWLRSIRGGTIVEFSDATPARAARLLSWYFREVFGVEPPSMGEYLRQLDVATGPGPLPGGE